MSVREECVGAILVVCFKRHNVVAMIEARDSDSGDPFGNIKDRTITIPSWSVLGRHKRTFTLIIFDIVWNPKGMKAREQVVFHYQAGGQHLATETGG